MIEVLRVQQGETLSSVLYTPATDEQVRLPASLFERPAFFCLCRKRAIRNILRGDKRRKLKRKRNRLDSIGPSLCTAMTCMDGCLFVLLHLRVLISLFSRLPLEGMKRKIQRNLRLLEADGLVSADKDYQEIITAIGRVRCSACLL